jgi:transcriptional regulator GlxA family with amidase domain
MVKRSDEIGPEKIVELARQYILRNLNGDLRSASIAKAVGIGVQDLKGSFHCATTTSIRKEVKTMRLHALYEESKLEPYGEVESQIRQCGLKPGAKLEDDFKQEFWISLEDHREQSRLLFGQNTHALEKFSPGPLQ